ncbi:hypothetical protein QVD17_29812 [Tagetes erecta]|uniref:Uncharacterized protein n=1 Tax=Tagetes erecta TaxID=13708 RepID=A0AAD8K1L5_TARER|nr:hypothetical protein QVD17_29812 [Tagetes erecta]
MDDVMRHGGDFAGQDPPLPGGFDAGHGHYEEEYESFCGLAFLSKFKMVLTFDQEFEEQINALFQDPYFRDQLRSLNLLQNGQSSDR